jgi:hypothetical protein
MDPTGPGLKRVFVPSDTLFSVDRTRVKLGHGKDALGLNSNPWPLIPAIYVASRRRLPFHPADSTTEEQGWRRFESPSGLGIVTHNRAFSRTVAFSPSQGLLHG